MVEHLGSAFDEEAVKLRVRVGGNPARQLTFEIGGALIGRAVSTSPKDDERSPSPIGWERVGVRVDWALLKIENTKAPHPNPLPSEGEGTFAKDI